MKLDKDLIKQLVEESLGTLFEEEYEVQVEQEMDELSLLRKENEELKTKLEELQGVNTLEEMNENFSISKSRLNQIITEEVIEAKKKGIL